jgi:hypothetical protein
MNHTKLNETLRGIQTGLFATKDSIEEAIQYAFDMIGAMPKEVQAPAYTVIHVLMNTIAAELKKIVNEGNEGNEESNDD